MRTAIGYFGGTLETTPVVQWGALVIREALERINLRPEPSREILEFEPESIKGLGYIELEKKYRKWDDSAKPIHVDEVMGNVHQGGQGKNTGRQVTIYAGMPKKTNDITVNKVCASGVKAIAIEGMPILSGVNEIVVAGGMENMSMAPNAFPKAFGTRMFNADVLDLMVHDGLW